MLCVGAVLLAGAMLLSFSRASVLAAALAFVTLAILERHRPRQRGQENRVAASKSDERRYRRGRSA